MPPRARPPDPRLVDQHNRISLTKEVRRTLGITPGDYIIFLVAPDGTVTLRKMILSIAPLPTPYAPPPKPNPFNANK